MCPEKNLTWANGKVKALGVWFCTDQNLGLKMNYEEKVRKFEDILNNWQNKRLTVLGKNYSYKGFSCFSSCIRYVVTMYMF